MTKPDGFAALTHEEAYEILVAIYQGGGQYAVYDFVADHWPGWDWADCEPCDDKTPTVPDKDKTCAVCGTGKA
jgi:hypothetical protein